MIARKTGSCSASHVTPEPDERNQPEVEGSSRIGRQEPFPALYLKESDVSVGQLQAGLVVAWRRPVAEIGDEPMMSAEQLLPVGQQEVGQL